MEFDTNDLNDEDIDKINDFILSLKKEKKPTKWWIMPNFDIFSKEYYNDDIKINYYIEEQKDSYSKTKPPLKSDFNSKEEAKKWLDKYISEHSMFNSARDDLNDLILGIDLLRIKLNKHEKIAQCEWNDCFKKFIKSVLDGNLYQVIEWNKNVEKPKYFMNMNVDNWELKDNCDEVQWYYQSKLNDDMIACIVTPHKHINFKWLLRIGFKSTFDKWGTVEYENLFDTFPLLVEFMSNEKHLKEIELMKGE